MNKSSVSRRNFLAGAGALAVGVAATGLAGCTTQPAATEVDWWLPEAWDAEADVVVVGYGGSGSLASLAALTEGASVIALEKSPYNTGGNLGCSGGNIHDCPGADVDEWLKLYTHGTFQTGASEETIRPVLEECVKCPDWLEEYGLDLVWTDLHGDGHTYPTSMVEGHMAEQDGMSGEYLFMGIDALCQDQDIDLRLGTSAQKLIQNPKTREILGVVAEDAEGNMLNIKARKGVVMACGGYEFNMDMFYNYNLPGIHLVGDGNPYNTGDGHKMATAVGADFWHMQEYHTGVMCLLQPSLAANSAIEGFSRVFDKGPWCTVDCNGKRFMNESYQRGHDSNHKAAFDYSTPWAKKKQQTESDDPSVLEYTTQLSDYVHLPMFGIFDQTIFEAMNPLAALSDGSEVETGYDFVYARFVDEDKTKPLNGYSCPSNDEAVKKGWIFKGDTIEELAANIKGTRPCNSEEDAIKGIDPAALAETIAKYNSYVDAGNDPDFMRTPSTMTGKIENGPFYAVEMQWSMDFTEGGPRRNSSCQTIDTFGNVIPRLYNTGEFGSFNSLAYTFGGIVQALTTGRIAGRHAAALDAWDADSSAK